MNISETSPGDQAQKRFQVLQAESETRTEWGGAGAGQEPRQAMIGGGEARECAPEIKALLELSSRAGRDPLLVQGSNSNTSVKINGTLWVKASGKSLANAGQQEILLPVQLADCLERFKRGDPLPNARECSCARRIHPSTETFLHAVLPHRIVVHVHSVNTIAWAVRHDAELQLQQRLYGLRWAWVPYAAPGLRLARKVRAARRRGRNPNIFVLGNHGLVVCGDDCKEVDDLLFDVNRRLAIPPRVVPQPNYGALEQVQCISGWRLPDAPAIHTLGTDRHSRRMLQGGVLYPCQAVFLGTGVPQLPRRDSPSGIRRRIARIRQSSPFLVVERSGVLVSEDITPAENAALKAYAEVLRRIETSVILRYLSRHEVRTILAQELC